MCCSPWGLKESNMTERLTVGLGLGSTRRVESPLVGGGGGVGNSFLRHPRRAEEEAREDKSVLPKTGGRGGGFPSG